MWGGKLWSSHFCKGKDSKAAEEQMHSTAGGGVRVHDFWQPFLPNTQDPSEAHGAPLPFPSLKPRFHVSSVTMAVIPDTFASQYPTSYAFTGDTLNGFQEFVSSQIAKQS